MFNKDKFSNILKTIVNNYDSITDFTNNAGVDRSYISKYINKRISSPPHPKILSRIAVASKGETTYEELMKICGYYENEVKRMNEEEQLKYSGDPKYLELCYPNKDKETKIQETNSQIQRLNNLRDDLQKQLENLKEWENESKRKIREAIEYIQKEILSYKSS